MGIRAVFLDRDGVINAPLIRDRKPYSPRAINDFYFLPRVAEACSLLVNAGFTLVVATNQPDVGRGIVPQPVIEEMHSLMSELLPIKRVEVCYDADRNSPSEFRKPKPGMLLRAANALGIDLSKSYMIGDRWKDIECGYAAGCRTVFIDWGYDEPLRSKPHLVASDLQSAALMVLADTA